jgi:hypothetical protein
MEKITYKELYDLFCSPNIIQAIILRKMRGIGPVAHMMDKINAFRILVEKSLSKATMWETKLQKGE